ncbi:MAG: K+/H+ antiporter subunit F, partial [Rhizobiaceae bacterium]
MTAAAVLFWSVTAAQIMLVAAMGCYAYRVVRGPRAQDRVLCLDAMYVC